MSIVIITIGALYYTYIQSSSSFPSFPPSPPDTRDDEKVAPVPLKRVRSHGTTLSLDTLLPLHHRPRSLSRLRAIYELEEEYTNNAPYLDVEKAALLLDMDKDGLTV